MMVEEYATHIWKRLGGACANMAAAIDDLICNFELTGVSMDIGTTLLLGWILFGVFLLALCIFIYQRHLKPRKSTIIEKEQATNEAAKASSPVSGKNSLTAASTFPGSRSKFSNVGGNSGGVSHLNGEDSGVVLKGTSIKNALTVNGIDKDSVDWVTRMLVWIFSDPKISVDVVNMWVDVLNVLNKVANTEHGVHVEIEQIKKDESVPPTISNVNIEVSPKDDISLICNAVIPQLTFIVHTSRQKGESTLVTVYRASITSYGGKLRVTCNPHDLFTTISLVDHPNLRIALTPVSGHQDVDAHDEQALQYVLDEILTNTLSTWILRIKFGEYRNCPVFRRAVIEAQPIKPIHYDSMTSNLPSLSPSTKKARRLLVKVIKANGLGTLKGGCKDPYCIIELDEPPQKHQTSFASNTDNPYWDEHFLFDLTNESVEILFELYDKAKPDRSAFLGLGIVSVHDLLKNTNQRQAVALQSRPYLEDPVSGSITVEFLYMDATDIPYLPDSPHTTLLQPSPINNKPRTETNRLVTPGGTMVTTTTTTISKPSTGTEVVCSKIEIEKDPLHAMPALDVIVNGDGEVDEKMMGNESTMEHVQNGDVMSNGVDIVTDTALRELENRQFAPLPPSTTTSKSTLIIHSVQRPPEVVVVDGDKLVADEIAKRDGTGKADSLASSSLSSKEDLAGGRSRPKERRSFVSTLKKRFSFRGNKRSKSMEHGSETVNRDDSNSRSNSADRARRINTGTNFLDVPGSSPIPHIPVITSPESGSTRSSLSEQSAISESSTQTYLNEMSTLVIETVENGLVKHYLLPASMARKSKWRKRGTKLHIFNDHIFVATHFPGSTPCQVCSKVMPRRIGKQGYECRDCQLKCHKVCHVKTDTPCPNSTANMLELSYEMYCSPSNNGQVANGHTTSLGQRRPLSIVNEE